MDGFMDDRLSRGVGQDYSPACVHTVLNGDGHVE